MSDFDAESIAKTLVKEYRGSALIAQIAAALRASEARGLERAAQVAKGNGLAMTRVQDIRDEIADAIRDLIE